MQGIDERVRGGNETDLQQKPHDDEIFANELHLEIPSLSEPTRSVRGVEERNNFPFTNVDYLRIGSPNVA
jgi:hypothetical protein